MTSRKFDRLFSRYIKCIDEAFDLEGQGRHESALSRVNEALMAANEITEHGGEGLDEELIEKMADMKERIVGDRLQETKERLEAEVSMTKERSKLKSVLRKVAALEANIDDEDVSIVKSKLNLLGKEAVDIINNLKSDDQMVDDLYAEIIMKINSFKLSNSELNSVSSGRSSRSHSGDRKSADLRNIHVSAPLDPTSFPKLPDDVLELEDWERAVKQRARLSKMSDEELLLILTDERVVSRRGLRAKLDDIETADEAFTIIKNQLMPVDEVPRAILKKWQEKKRPAEKEYSEFVLDLRLDLARLNKPDICGKISSWQILQIAAGKLPYAVGPNILSAIRKGQDDEKILNLMEEKLEDQAAWTLAKADFTQENSKTSKNDSKESRGRAQVNTATMKDKSKKVHNVRVQ